MSKYFGIYLLSSNLANTLLVAIKSPPSTSTSFKDISLPHLLVFTFPITFLSLSTKMYHVHINNI